VKGCERDDGVESALRRLPRLKGRVDDLDVLELGQVAAGGRGELLAELDGDDPEAALGERSSRLAGAGPDLEDAPARGNAGELYQAVENLRRVRRARAIVELRDLLEGLPQLLAPMR
jgi:hypothetical protein